MKKRIPPCIFLKFYTHLGGNSTRSFQNVFDQSSRVLNLVFPRKLIFHEHRHILGYHTPLMNVSLATDYWQTGFSELSRSDYCHHFWWFVNVLFSGRIGSVVLVVIYGVIVPCCELQTEYLFEML